MAKLKRLVNTEDEIVKVYLPVTNEEIEARELDYQVETPEKFAKKYRHRWHEPVTIFFNGREHKIQLNRCTDPFCKNSRYKLAKSTDRKEIVCNPDPSNKFGIVTSSATSVVSNWSVAEEISRLARNDKVMDVEPDYCFHRDGCISHGLTPFKHPHHFHSRGKNSANSHRWQCKECRKITNVCQPEIKRHIITKKGVK